MFFDVPVRSMTDQSLRIVLVVQASSRLGALWVGIQERQRSMHVHEFRARVQGNTVQEEWQNLSDYRKLWETPVMNWG